MTEIASVTYTEQQRKYLASLLSLRGDAEDKLTQSIKRARVDMNPHQVDAALFAIRSPISSGVVLADEVGLGKTIEASLVMAQKWAERKRRLLLVVPASLRKQWSQELWDKFSLPSYIIEAKNFNETLKKHRGSNPFDKDGFIVICSYQFASAKHEFVQRVAWDLVVYDEAHKLRNVYKKDGSAIAKKLRIATGHATKLLLTATPLQNSLMELYGLVSIIDEHFFGSEQAFKQQYVSGRGGMNLPVLKNRMKAICQRTLRKQAQEAGMARFTKRYLITEDFTPSADELTLYETVSSYLQRPEIKAMKPNGRHLVTLAIRKILASSSFAIGDTLRKMIERLESKRAINLETVDDFDAVDETAEELEVSDDGPEDLEGQILGQEIAELKAMRELALGIRDNAKGSCLVMALGKYLDSIVERGGNRKAVIFTESVRTQAYLKQLLTANGYEGKIVLLNGSNSDQSSQELYRAWKEKHNGTDAISGSKSADIKAAIVDAFKNNAEILIATESGAEGINLQFCSLLVNYDLPWNPQRVEQRIGRCHRYGQKLDVAVLNFINKGNRAEERVFQLLNQKFQLFDGVFGSSDQVLSAIESGVDIEQKILAVIQKCRTAAEIDAEFDRLQIELKESIDEQDENARQALLQAMDESVVERLKMRKENTEHRLSRHDRYLLMLTRSELDSAVFINPKRFEYRGETYSMEWPAADENNWQFYRISEGTLADEVVQRAKQRAVSSGTVRFHYDAYSGDGQLSDLKPFIGTKGHLHAAKLTITNAVSVSEHIVISGTTDDGKILHPDMLHHLLLVPGESVGVQDLTEVRARLEDLQKGRLDELFKEAEGQNLEYLDEETEKLNRWEEESTAAIDAQIKELRKLANELDRQSRNPTLAMKDKLALKRQAAHHKGEATKKKKDYFEEQEKIALDRKSILDEIENKLEIKQVVEPMFTMRWELI